MLHIGLRRDAAEGAWGVRLRRSATWLALFALLLQLALSFGHVHGLDANDRPTLGLAGTSLPAGSNHHPAGDPHDICAICVAMGLLASAPLPPPPLVPLPSAFAIDPPDAKPITLTAVATRLAYRSRAPPYA
jgi:hypothetical protein